MAAGLAAALTSGVVPLCARTLVITPALPSKMAPGRGNYVFGMASGPPGSTEYAAAGQLAALSAMDQEEGPHGESGPRIAPLVTEAGSRNILDLLSASTTDLALIPVPPLLLAARERPAIKSRIAYVAPLYLQEVHVIARDEITDLTSLRGLRVALGARGGVGWILFNALKIEVEASELSPEQALSHLASGDVDAVVLVSGGPVSALAAIGPEKRLRLVQIPYTDDLQGDFLPVQLERKDYPGLIKADGVPSLAVQTVLAAYIWPRRSERARLLSTLVTGLLDHIDDANAAGEVQKLRDVNWAASLPGWTRLDAAQKWLETRAQPLRGANPAITVKDKGKQ